MNSASCRNKKITSQQVKGSFSIAYELKITTSSWHEAVINNNYSCKMNIYGRAGMAIQV